FPRGPVAFRLRPRQCPDRPDVPPSGSARAPEAVGPPHGRHGVGTTVSTAPSWHHVRERGSLLAMRFIVWLYRLFGRRLCGVLILPVVGYFYLTGAQARHASRRYLARLHEWSGGRLPRRAPPTWRDGFRHFRQFGLNILDRVGFWLGDTSGFELIVHG